MQIAAPTVLHNLNLRNLRIIDVLIFSWALLIMQADIGSITFNGIHWLASILILLFATLYFKGIVKYFNFYLYGIFLITFATLVGVYTARSPSYNLIQAAKLTIIFMTYFLLISDVKYLSAIFKAFVCAVIINFLFIVLGCYFPWIAFIKTTDDRWATIFNYPGSLAKVGMVVFFYAFYLLLYDSRKKIKHVLLLLMCLTLILCDGSRSAQLVIIINLSAIAIAYLAKKKRTLLKINLNSTKVIALIFLFLLCNLILIYYQNEIVNWINHSRIIYFIKCGLFEGNIRQTDEIRYHMLQTVFQQIQSHPLLGQGMGTARVTHYLESGWWLRTEQIDIHNAYLQIWSCVGLLGFLGFVLLNWGWLLYLSSAFNILKNLDIRSKAIGYNAIFILFYFAINNFFHPLSSQWSEWLFYLYALGIYWYLLNFRRID